MDTPPPTITPQPVLTPAEAQVRTWSMLVHLSAFFGYVIPALGWVLGPLLVWQIKKHEMPAIAAHGRAAVNFQLSCLLYTFLACLLIPVLVGFPLLAVIGVFNIVCIIIAALRANDGIPWRYPLTIRFLS